MTNGPATPNGCGFGFTMLSEYCVAMAAVSLALGRRVDNGACKSRGSAPCAKIAVEPSTANQTSTKRASPDESFGELSEECSAIRDRSKVALAVGRIVHLHNRLLRCVTRRLVRRDARRPTGTTRAGPRRDILLN